MINPKSLDNLQPFGTLDADRQRELSRKGGLASAAARKARKEETELIQALLKYGSAFTVFARLCERPPKDFERIVTKAKEGLQNDTK
jgi:hypothetical protein